MMKGTAAGAALLLLTASGGCGTDTEPAGETAPTRPPFEVAPMPTLRVGVVEGDPMQQLDGVAAAFLLPGGDLAIADRGSSSMRVFSGTDGAFLESHGGPGEGPGEFAGLRGAWARGDTIEAWDADARRVTRFVPGAEVDVVTLGSGGGNLDAGVGPLGDGWAIASLSFGDGRDVMVAEAFARAGEHLGSAARLAGMARHASGNGSGPHPVTPTALVRAHDGLLYVAETDSPVIRVLDAAGDTVREVRLPVTPAGSPDAVLAAVVDSAVARADSGRADAARERWGAFPVPDRIPLVQGFLVDSEGLVWVRPWEPFRHALALGGTPDGRPGPGGEWIVVSPAGRELGRVTVPPELEPLSITRDAVVGIARDDLGVESVRVHRLTRNAGG